MTDETPTTPETPAEPVRLRYLGEDTFALPGFVRARPSAVSPDSRDITVPARYADAILARGDFAPAGEDALKGRELDEALVAAGLPKTGTADDKRARLAEYMASDAETPSVQAGATVGDQLADDAPDGADTGGSTE